MVHNISSEDFETTLDGIRDIKILQSRDGYRFSVDPLLLYSFVHVRHVSEIVDLGAGSGIVGLLLARKFVKARVLLVEVQDSLYRLAARNIELNDLTERVGLLHADMKELKVGDRSETVDLVVSNPPYREPDTGRISLGQERAVARHEILINLPDLVGTASYILKPRGRFCMIYHPGRLLEAFDALRGARLEPKRIRFVHNDIRSVSKIVLIEAVKDGRPGMKIERPLYIYGKDGTYTQEVQLYYTVNN